MNHGIEVLHEGVCESQEAPSQRVAHAAQRRDNAKRFRWAARESVLPGIHLPRERAIRGGMARGGRNEGTTTGITPWRCHRMAVQEQILRQKPRYLPMFRPGGEAAEAAKGAARRAAPPPVNSARAPRGLKWSVQTAMN